MKSPERPTGSASATSTGGRASSSLFRRLYLGYVAVIALVTVVLAALIEIRLRDALEQDLGVALEREANHLAELVGALAAPRADAPPGEALDSTGLASLEERVERLGRATGTRLTVIGAGGKVLADSSQEPARMDDHGTRPEVLEAQETGRGRARRFSSTLGAEFVYEARRVEDAGPLTGAVARAALSVATVDVRLGELRRVALLGALSASVLGLLAGLFFARRASARVAAVTASVEAIARGQGAAEDVRLRAGPGDDELGRLVAAVNRMADELRERMRTISVDRNKLLAILGGMVEGVIAVDREERVVHMNAVAGRLLGVSPRESAGKRIWEVTRVVEIPEILERTGSREEVAGSVELRFEGSSEPRAIELAASPLLDAAGAVAGAVVVLHDVTELRHLEQVRRDFVANVSHELKTPLTAIRGLIETVIDDEQMDRATVNRFAGKIRDQALRLSALVTDLLTLARVEASPAAGVPRELARAELAGIVRECAARSAPPCQAKSVELALSLPAGPVPLFADEEDLRQIVGNLLDNAVKYTPAGGRVDVRVSEGRGEVVLEVSDTGIGIEPRDQDRIFERFYRVDKARSRELGGTGLGLSIVKHLVLKLDGRITLESTPGRGSTFRVRLPQDRRGI